MIPIGPIYLCLRGKLLSSFPHFCRRSSYGHTFLHWMHEGAYIVRGVTPSSISLEAAVDDLSGSILTDIEHLFNHCFEHIQEVMCCDTDSRARSDAWTVVTLYYLAFFAAQALLRLIGSPIVFITRPYLKPLASMAGLKHSLAQGAYRITKRADISATHASYDITAAGGKVHEATWKTLLGLLDRLLTNKALLTDAREVAVYKDISTKCLFHKYDSYEWPSRVRIAANYRIGFAYRMVEGSFEAKAKGLVGRWQRRDASATTLLHSSVAACAATNAPFASHVRLMNDVGLMLFAIARRLYSELISRKGVDKRWEQRRQSFLAEMVPGAAEFVRQLQTSK